MTSLTPTADEVAEALVEAGVSENIDFEYLLTVVATTGVRWARSIDEVGGRAEFLLDFARVSLAAADRKWTNIDALEAVLAVAQLDQATFDLLAAHADEVMP